MLLFILHVPVISQDAIQIPCNRNGINLSLAGHTSATGIEIPAAGAIAAVYFFAEHCRCLQSTGGKKMLSGYSLCARQLRVNLPVTVPFSLYFLIQALAFLGV